MWKGGNFVNVERRDQGLISTLEGMHRSEGAGIGWILFADSIGGSLILLSLTGVLLWTELTRRKTIGASIFAVSLVPMIVLAMQSVWHVAEISHPIRCARNTTDAGLPVRGSTGSCSA